MIPLLLCLSSFAQDEPILVEEDEIGLGVIEDSTGLNPSEVVMIREVVADSLPNGDIFGLPRVLVINAMTLIVALLGYEGRQYLQRKRLQEEAETDAPTIAQLKLRIDCLNSNLKALRNEQEKFTQALSSKDNLQVPRLVLAQLDNMVSLIAEDLKQQREQLLIIAEAMDQAPRLAEAKLNERGRR